MKCWDLPSIKVGFANGAEIGLKIDEKFKEGHLVTFLKNYADGNGIGGNIITSRLLIKYTMEITLQIKQCPEMNWFEA